MEERTLDQPGTDDGHRSPRQTNALPDCERVGRNEFVASFARGLSVLRAFGPDHRVMTLSEVAERSDQTRSSARRFLLTLVSLGYVRQERDRYSITAQALAMIPSYLHPRSLAHVAAPLVEAVARELGETASVGILSGEVVEIIAYGRAPRQMSLNLTPGDRLPLFCSAQGRVLLAGLPDAQVKELFARQHVDRLTPQTKVTLGENVDAVQRARRDGYVILDEELEEGVRSVAMPIRDRSGAVLAAMSTCAHANRASVADLTVRFKPVLERTIVRIEQSMD